MWFWFRGSSWFTCRGCPACAVVRLMYWFHGHEVDQVSWGTLTLSDLTPHHQEPEGQSAVMAGALSLGRSAGGVCGVMRSR